MSDPQAPNSRVNDPRDRMPSTADDEETGFGGNDADAGEDTGEDEVDDESEFGHA